MKLQLVAFSVFVFLLQVIPAYGDGRKCRNKLGTCRKHCKYGEAIKEVCKNHRICCISASKSHSQGAFDKILPKATPTTWYDLPSGAFDVIMTVPAANRFEENVND
ncbi:beta-defensin 118 [Fukomys damarensis]|uniref:Beta-defensin 118 n=1 Tax=Fukomys damarensis TaxID=885580 RepID=A0A091DZ21_FUKDA|nr:beta-defensin 118 [Fukomys damarensis]KFO37359.1 Beta-defensin 118 [Fukomys damarensis]